MDDPDVVLSIDRNADRVADDPMVRQRLGPHRIHFKPRRLNCPALVRSLLAQHNGTDSEDHEGGAKGRANAQIDLHGLSLLRERISYGDSAHETCRSVDILLHAAEQLSMGIPQASSQTH